MLVSIDEGDKRPIYEQLVSQIKEQIMNGTLCPDDELPSVRELSKSLGVNLHTVHRAYQKLRDERVIQLRLGRRAKVAALRRTPAGSEEIQAHLCARLNELITDAFHLGLSVDDLKQLVDELLEAKERARR